jgi:hypothetical protein
MAQTFDEIAQSLLAIVSKSPNGIGWYGAEMRCSIPRSEFPDGMNVGSVLEELVAQGVIVKSVVDGKEKYFSASAP